MIPPLLGILGILLIAAGLIIMWDAGVFANHQERTERLQQAAAREARFKQLEKADLEADVCQQLDEIVDDFEAANRTLRRKLDRWPAS